METVLIASFLEPKFVAQIAGVAPVRIVYDPALLPRPRYQCDHVGHPLQRSEQDEQRWRQYLAQAEILFDFDYTNLKGLKDLIPNVRWIQGTSTGIGQVLLRSGLIESPIVFTTARGIHGKPLADFVLMAMLWFAKDGFRMVRDQAAHRWERYCGRDLAGSTVGIIGFGSIGREVAARCRALDMRVIATRRTLQGRIVDEGIARRGQAEAGSTRDLSTGAAGTADATADIFVPVTDLTVLLRQADFVVLAVPQTPQTEGLIGEAEVAAMKPGAVVINVARGAVIDEPALIAALREGRLGGAALDVFAKEPLPQNNPLWDLPNVLVSPHSASTVDTENAQLTDLFCENLGRYLRREPLLNVFDKERLY